MDFERILVGGINPFWWSGIEPEEKVLIYSI
jgi:hypothetical protein